MRFCQTDLAANAYRWRRMVKEDKRFGPLDPAGASSANDGMMASLLLKEGWKVSCMCAWGAAAWGNLVELQQYLYAAIVMQRCSSDGA